MSTASNLIRINNERHIALNVEKIAVGVEDPTRREVLHDSSTDLNYARNAVDAHEVFDASKQEFSNCFLLALETGSRGWFPGAVARGIIRQLVEIKDAPSDTATTLKTITDADVEILNIQSIKEAPVAPEGWYKIQYDVVGYIPITSVAELYYGEAL